MVVQDYALYPPMTVYEHMAYGLSIRQLSQETIHQKVTQAVQVLGPTAYLGQKPTAFSGGQRQRVAVGRTRIRKPEVCLFDEPLSNLDVKLRTMGDHMCVLDAGRIMRVGTPLAWYERPANRPWRGPRGEARHALPPCLRSGKRQECGLFKALHPHATATAIHC